jgi:hypothetical protein
MKNPLTTICGCVAVIGAAIALTWPEHAKLGAFLGLLASGMGNIFSRDWNKTSEQMGITPGPAPGAGTATKLGVVLLLCLGIGFGAVSCGKTLEPGGAYAPAGQVPSLAFFEADSAFDLAYATVNAAFTFERDNRDLLWRTSPQIKHTLDEIRPKAWEWAKSYATARKAYLANPVPSGLPPLEQALSEIQRLAATALAALPQKTP